MPIPTVRWGATSSGYDYANELLLGYPLYDIVTDRRLRAGAMTVQRSCGQGEDGWTMGYEYRLDAVARFIPENLLGLGSSAPVRSTVREWQRFLDYARAKHPFRLVPDSCYPNVYVDACYLEAPVTELFGPNNPRGERDVQLAIVSTDRDFTAALNGVLFAYRAGADLAVSVPSSCSGAASAAGSGMRFYHDADGFPRLGSSSAARLYGLSGGERVLVAESCYANRLGNTEDLRGGLWTWASTTMYSTAATGVRAIGDLTLTWLQDNSTAYWQAAQTFNCASASTYRRGLSFYIARGTSPGNGTIVDICRSTDGNYIVGQAYVKWSTLPGADPQIGAGVGNSQLLGVDYLAQRLYRVRMVVSSSFDGSLQHNVRIFPAAMSTVFSGSGASTDVGDVWIGGVQVEDYSYCASYLRNATTVPAAYAFSEDVRFGIKFPPPSSGESYTGYLRFATDGIAANSENLLVAPGLFALGSLPGATYTADGSFSVDAFLRRTSTGNVEVRAEYNGAALTAIAGGYNVPSTGYHELLFQITPTTSGVGHYIRAANASNILTGPSSWQVIGSAPWRDDTIALDARTNGVERFIGGGVSEFIVATCQRTIAEMRAL